MFALRIASLFMTLSLAAASLGCSALINPDEDLLPSTVYVDAGGRVDLGGFDADMLDMNVTPDANVELDLDVPDTSGCVPNFGCADGTMTLCDGSPIICVLGCNASSTDCARMVASNVGGDLWLDDAEDVDIRGSGTNWNTNACSLGSTDTMIVSQSDGTEVCVVRVRDFTVRSSGVLGIEGSRPLVILASGSVVIEGNIDATARLGDAGPGGARGGIVRDPDGEGEQPGRAGTHEDDWDDGGGGGGGLCGGGGRGGDSSTAEGGEGGAIISSWTLEPLFGGSGGASGGGEVSEADTNAGLGGAGGGAIQISALVSINISGRITAGGGGGGGGRIAIEGNFGSGGGGGSGGAVLIEAPTVLLGASSAVIVRGGGGGAASSNFGDGGDGSDGAFTDTPSVGGVHFGGAPGGGWGANGADAQGEAGESSGVASNGGGGGGGAGCVFFRTAAGATPPDLTSRIAPSVSAIVHVERIHTR